MHLDKQLERKNKILALILAGIALVGLLGAIAWFSMYAPMIVK